MHEVLLHFIFNILLVLLLKVNLLKPCRKPLSNYCCFSLT